MDQTVLQYPTSRFLGILTKVAVLSTFLMIFAGALITGNKAALSDPTWPQFVGSWYPRLDQMVGGILYEDGHRIKGMVLGLLIITLTAVTLRQERRPVVRRLTWFALALVVTQGLIGGLIIKTYRPVWVSMLHASTAQAFFITVITLAVLQSKAWSRIQSMRPMDHPALIPIAKYAALVLGGVYLQVILGAGVRHSDRDGQDHFLPYVLAHITLGTCIVVAGWVLWHMVREQAKDLPLLRTPANWIAAIVTMQFSLGIPSIFSNRARLEMDSPHIWDVAVTSAHVLGAAVLLGLLTTLVSRARALATVPTWTREKVDPASESVPASGVNPEASTIVLGQQSH
jgi:cytochrome c oxidase assembly protein subunit 15